MLPRTRSSKPLLKPGLEKFRQRGLKEVGSSKEVPRKSPSDSDTSDESIGGVTQRRLDEVLSGEGSGGVQVTGGLAIKEVELEGTEENTFVNIDLGNARSPELPEEFGPNVEVVFQEMAEPPPAIDPLVRPRGLPIVVPRGLLATNIPAHLPKFYGSKDEDPSLHMEKYIEILTISLITDEGYYLVWFPTTLHGEAYNWYRDHEEGHFVSWRQLQVAFLNHFRPEVGQSTALRALAAVKQERGEEMATYIRRFELVCMRFVGDMLNNDTLKQFFIEGFFNRSTIRGVLERNPITLEDAKTAARVVDALERNYERLWRKEDESIPQFVPLKPRAAELVPTTEASSSRDHSRPVHHDLAPLETRVPEPMLALTAPRLEKRVEDLEKKIQTGQEGFQDSVMKQIQALTDQMACMVRTQSQNPLPPRIESGNHNSGIWCTICNQNGHSSPFCTQRVPFVQNNQHYQPPQRYERNRNQHNRQGGYQGNLQGHGGGGRPRKDFHEFCGRWHEPGQCWSENQWICGNCGGNHLTQDCRQPDKMIQLPPPVMNPYENARDNMRGQRRDQGDEQRGLRPPNLYYNYEESRQNHRAPDGLQTQKGYIPVNQNQQGGRQNNPQPRQSPNQNQDVRVAEEIRMSSPFPSQTNSTVVIEEHDSTSHLITHALEREGMMLKDSTVAVTTRAQALKEPTNLGVESPGSSASEDLPDLQVLDDTAKEAAKIAVEAGVEQSCWEQLGGKKLECGEDLEEEEMDNEDWKGPDIPLEEFEFKRHMALRPTHRAYDLWKDLQKVKADITLAQLLEVSPLMRKSFKEGLPVARRKRKVKSKLVARAEGVAKLFDVQAVEIDVEIVDKVIPNVLVDGGSGLNIMPLHTMEKLGLSLTGPSPFVLNMADQSPAKPVGQIQNCKMLSGGVEYLVTFHVIKMFASKEAFPLLLGRPWLRMANATVNWGGEKPAISYGPPDKTTKVRIKPMRVTSEERNTSSEPGEKTTLQVEVGSIQGNTLVGQTIAEELPKLLTCLGPSLYNWQDNGDFGTWLEEHPRSSSDLEMDVHFLDMVAYDEGLVTLIDIKEELTVANMAEQDLDILEGEETLEGSLRFKTGSSGIIAGENIASYPNVPTDWYKDNSEQSHVTEEDWKYVTIKMEGEEDKQIKMGSSLSTGEVESYSALVKEYRDVFAWSYTELKGIPSNVVEHRIPLMPGAVAIRQKERRMNPQLQLMVKAELEKLIQAKFIQPVEITDWVSPMVLVKKKNGKLRVCVDYRKLNSATQKDHFPLPFITNILEEVAGHERYTFMDGYSGYNQVSIALVDRHKTAFTTPWGTFVWHVMPFGLCNAPATFQRLVMSIFSDLLYKSMTVFIDDFSTQSGIEDHLGFVRESLERCRQSQMALNPEKTYLAVSRGVLLGYVVSKAGREPEPEKVKVITNLKPPTNVKEVQRVLGHVGWYRELIPNYATITLPITKLQQKHHKFEWTRACEVAFGLLKEKLSTYPVLRPPRWGMAFHVYCDASALAVGSVLCQPVEGQSPSRDFPIAYASRQLNHAEKNYSTTERECLAMVFSVKKFRHYLLSHQVVFYVDHMAIKYLVNKPELSGRLARWVLLLQEFDYTVEYKPGSAHKQADHLSRLLEGPQTLPLDDNLVDETLFLVTARPLWYAGIVDFLTTQQFSPEVSKEERRKIRVNSRRFVVLGNRLYRRGLDGILRRCVVEAEVESILSACHDSACGGHFSGQLTGQKVLRAGYFWPTLFQDAHKYVRKCDACQRFARNDLHMQLPLHISLPLVPFEKWGIDYVGEIHPHSSRGMAYIIVATEYLTKWVEAKAVRSNDAKNAAVFLFENVITRFGVPKILVSDRGTHFLNEVIEAMTERFQIDHRKTTPYHPQTNGQTERVNQTLGTILRKTVRDSKRDWDVKLPAALWAYRTTYKVTTRATPFSLVHGIEAVLPIEFEVPSLRIAIDARLTESQSLKARLVELEALDEGRRRAAQHIEAIQRRRKVLFDKRHKVRVLQPGMLVLLQDARKVDFPSKFDAVWLGPYLVTEVFLNNSVQLETLNGQRFPTRTAGSRCKEYRT